MSIRVQIKDRSRELLRAGKLVRLPALYDGDPRKRCIFVTESIAADIVAPDGGLPNDDDLAQFRGNLDSFAVGEQITIAKEALDKDPTSDLAPLHPPSCRVWDFRVRDAPKEIRCGGFFAAKDFFVAVHWAYRSAIKRDEWPDFIRECQTIWDDLYGPLAPHYGVFPDAYISQPFRIG